MATLPFPMIPMGNSTNRPTTSSAGAIRWNTTSNAMETYNGTVWVPFRADPETWQEWFDYYVSSTKENPDTYARRDTIHKLMQEKFPGQYRVDNHNGVWEMIHNTPADETWFHLQYA